MGKKKLACCVGLGVLLIAGNAEASDINPMKQHHEAVKKEYSAAVERQMDELSPARQEHAWALGEELGMAGAIPADVKKKIGDLAVEDAEARVIDNIPINRARAALSSAAGDYEALKARYGMREKMLPAWDKEKQKILSKLSGVKKQVPRYLFRNQNMKKFMKGHIGQRRIFTAFITAPLIPTGSSPIGRLRTRRKLNF